MMTGNCDSWYLRGFVKGVSVEWLVDTGANPNILSHGSYMRIPSHERPSLEPVNGMLNAANGKGITI